MSIYTVNPLISAWGTFLGHKKEEYSYKITLLLADGSKKDAITIDKQLAERKEMFSTLDIKQKAKRFYRNFLFRFMMYKNNKLNKIFFLCLYGCHFLTFTLLEDDLPHLNIKKNSTIHITASITATASLLFWLLFWKLILLVSYLVIIRHQ